MNRREALLTVGGLLAGAAVPLQAAPLVHVYKNPSCGCCTQWVEHLRANGFAVKVTEVEDTAPMRKRLGMPEAFAGCHTASVESYVLEGHVPAREVKLLMSRRPKAIGLAVPGMPVGSPGMEIDGRVDAFDVLLIDPAGRSAVFARYPKRES